MTRMLGGRAARWALALGLLGSPAVAAGSRKATAPPRVAVRSNAVRQAWTALVHFAARLGSGMDPNGAHASSTGTQASPATTTPATPTSDRGSIMDPNG
jgi:hypothetical protein